MLILSFSSSTPINSRRLQFHRMLILQVWRSTLWIITPPNRCVSLCNYQFNLLIYILLLCVQCWQIIGSICFGIIHYRSVLLGCVVSLVLQCYEAIRIHQEMAWQSQVCCYNPLIKRAGKGSPSSWDWWDMGDRTSFLYGNFHTMNFFLSRLPWDRGWLYVPSNF